MQNLSVKYNKIFKKDGVVLVKNAWKYSNIKRVINEYNKNISKIQRKESNLPKGKPIIILWKHVVGEKKRIGLFNEFPELWNFIINYVTPMVKKILNKQNSKLQLLETIIFNKPYKISNYVQWHQDASTWPLMPNNQQVAAWIPFEQVDDKAGALRYALGSHKLGIRAATDLHTSKKNSKKDKKTPVSQNPQKLGFKVKTMKMSNRDILCHHGFVWHFSKPNLKLRSGRRGLTIRYILKDVKYKPVPGQAAAFIKQIKVKRGQVIKGPSFPKI